MTRKQAAEPMLTAAEAAARTGLTVRALRVYEARGLLDPPRTGKGWRLYGPREFQRLGVIQALKSLGLPLAEVSKVLAGDTPSLRRVLEVQAALWRGRLAAAQAGLDLVEQALARTDTSRPGTTPISVEDLCTLIRRLDMNTMPETLRTVLAEDYTAEERATLMTPRGTEEAATEGARAWNQLIADIQALRQAGVPASDARARDAARRWQGLVAAFTQGDADVAQRTAGLWRKALDRDPQGQGLPFDQGLWDYVAAAMKTPQA
ncbi:MerR family transcriptional regulator [Nitrospirillum sp. BR 11163]|uniref:MerR family transcriptional regulator n=1 Tax=Nitrospirillum sp. BR 11163 TaxID=3104323 RepID=UPI002AFF1AF9|nr:MerR family transcriptional regulator [Nitrospirillum sp. BR 11163]MEA1674400.1 MerR family transcriptional regulator [Nitrospirillum sp. BR 11163]